MEDEFGNLIVVMVQLVLHHLVAIALLAEIYIEIAIIRIVGVRTGALGGITIIVEYHSHRHGHTAVGGTCIIATRGFVINGRVCIIVFILVPAGSDKRRNHLNCFIVNAPIF